MTARQYGTLGIVGVGGWVLANLLLHVLVPELSVVKNTLSEYALGDFGWLSRASALANGVGLVAIAFGLRASLAPGKRVTASWVLMLVAGLLFFSDVVFVTDAMEAEETTVSGGIHILAFVVTILCLLVAVWMLRGVFARDDGWRHFQRTQHWFAVAFSIGFVGMFVLVDVPGLVQRALVVVIASWWLALAVNMRRAPEVHSDRAPTVPAEN